MLCQPPAAPAARPGTRAAHLAHPAALAEAAALNPRSPRLALFGGPAARSAGPAADAERSGVLGPKATGGPRAAVGEIVRLGTPGAYSGLTGTWRWRKEHDHHGATAPFPAGNGQLGLCGHAGVGSRRAAVSRPSPAAACLAAAMCRFGACSRFPPLLPNKQTIHNTVRGQNISRMMNAMLVCQKQHVRGVADAGVTGGRRS